jgi:hypothetical protein
MWVFYPMPFAWAVASNYPTVNPKQEHKALWTNEQFKKFTWTLPNTKVKMAPLGPFVWAPKNTNSWVPLDWKYGLRINCWPGNFWKIGGLLQSWNLHPWPESKCSVFFWWVSWLVEKAESNSRQVVSAALWTLTFILWSCGVNLWLDWRRKQKMNARVGHQIIFRQLFQIESRTWSNLATVKATRVWQQNPVLFFFQEGVPTVQPVSLSDYHMFHQDVQVGAAVLLMNPRVQNPQRAGPPPEWVIYMKY